MQVTHTPRPLDGASGGGGRRKGVVLKADRLLVGPHYILYTISKKNPPCTCMANFGHTLEAFVIYQLLTRLTFFE